ncbi:hypothetical protein [Pseudomonas sp. HY2-MNA-CIBAN-0224]|uniref:hypothetical protein n=1 Tax=Pseudomonas sp. HY2-MNA-CIBAN-0224 TaxID=3140471 RepID=UPI00331C22C6
MTLEALACIYFAGAVITGFPVTKLNHFYRCVLIWPLFWLLLLVVVLEMALEDLRHDS